MRKRTIMSCLLLLLAMPAFGQEAAKSDEAEQSKEAIKERMAERIRRAARLPGTAEQAREAGVPDEEVREVLERGKTSRVPASDMQEVLEQETRSVKEHGPIDNFGTFVQQKLDQGLRGQELADAIHQEHAARGKGKYRDKAHKPGKGNGKDKSKNEGLHDDDSGEHEGRFRKQRDHEDGNHRDDDDEGEHRDHEDGDHHDDDDDHEGDMKGKAGKAREEVQERRDTVRGKIDKAADKATKQNPKGKRPVKKEDE